MLFVREEIPSKLLSEYKPNSSVENIFIEINLRSKKWLLPCSYNPNLTILLTVLPRDIEILGWCPAGPVLPHWEKVPL